MLLISVLGFSCLSVMVMTEDLIPLRMLNEFVYCPRLFWIEYVDNEFVDSEDTINGRFVHRNVDKVKSLPEDISDKFSARSIMLSSEKYGIIGKLDMVEGKDEHISPIEYKSGSMRDDNQAWETDTMQVAAQALLLRENGYTCDEAYIYYEKNRKKIAIPISENILDKTIEKIDEVKALLSTTKIPEPLIDSPKCIRCSLAAVCLPDEFVYLSAKGDDEIRRLYPARDDIYPMYVREQGAVIGKKNNQLTVRTKAETTTVNIMDISNLSIFGNVQISTQVMHELFRRDIPVCYFSLSGWFYGMSFGHFNKNGELRIAQYKSSIDERKSLNISRTIISGKIKNSRTLLRRNSKNRSEVALSELKKSIDDAMNAKTPQELLGVEGNAARIYFSNFTTMLKSDLKYEFENRNRRPPKDPVNALLSYLYAILLKDVTVSLVSVGLDPYVGFFHRMKYGKPSLALDLMEEYRSIVCDSVLLGLINNSIIKKDDFLYSGRSVALKDNSKKDVLSYYENRMDSLIRHPVFGYTISYRRTIEVQARLLARWITGEIKEYIPMSTK